MPHAARSPQRSQCCRYDACDNLQDGFPSFFFHNACVFCCYYLLASFNVEHSPSICHVERSPLFVERLPSICHVERSRDISRPLGRLAKPKYLLRRFKRSLHSLRSVEMTRGKEYLVEMTILPNTHKRLRGWLIVRLSLNTGAERAVSLRRANVTSSCTSWPSISVPSATISASC